MTGKLEHLFDEYTSIHVSDVAFFPSVHGRSYDFYASSTDKNDVLYINLQSGKVEMIEGMGETSIGKCYVKLYSTHAGNLFP